MESHGAPPGPPADHVSEFEEREEWTVVTGQIFIACRDVTCWAAWDRSLADDGKRLLGTRKR